MTMQILCVSLYGKNGERRDIQFDLGKVNIITGASQKGKTSLIDIVEYCLGASECMVAAGHIRRTVDWYSVLLQFPDCQVFIARAVPLPGEKASSAAFMLVENKILLPEKGMLSNSTNIDSVVSFLTSKVGIPEFETEVPEGQSRPTVELGFRHSRYYLFQRQNEIANNEILFHQQARAFIPQNIKDTLPYFIGAAEENRLTLIEQLRRWKKERAALFKQVVEIEALQGDGLQKGYVLLSEAANLGLYQGTDLIPTEGKLLECLRSIGRWSPDEILGDDLTDPIVALEYEQQQLNQRRNFIKVQLREANDYALREVGFEQAVAEQSYRLQSVGLFKKFDVINDLCPYCSTPHSDGSESTFEATIKSALEDLSSKLDGVGRSKPRITLFVSKLQEELRQVGIEIGRIRSSIGQIRGQENERTKFSDLNHLRARLTGKVSLYLESINWSNDISAQKNQIAFLDEKISELSEKLDPSELRDRLESQLECIADDMTAWAQALGLGYSNNRIKLDPSKLTVVANTPDGPVYLDKMGSGENWMGYHVVTHLALAKWFIERSRPVGNFLFLDQPTQVYFPADKTESKDFSKLKDEDRIAVTKLFKFIFQVVEQLAPRLQVIITDHADIDEPWFQDAVKDRKWRGDYALIPKHWFE